MSFCLQTDAGEKERHKSMQQSHNAANVMIGCAAVACLYRTKGTIAEERAVGLQRMENCWIREEMRKLHPLSTSHTWLTPSAGEHSFLSRLLPYKHTHTPQSAAIIDQSSSPFVMQRS